MCLAAAYLNTGGDEPILRDIARMRFNGDRVELETLFGEERVIPGRVLEVDFSTSKIIMDQCHASAIEGDSNTGDRA